MDYPKCYRWLFASTLNAHGVWPLQGKRVQMSSQNKEHVWRSMGIFFKQLFPTEWIVSGSIPSHTTCHWTCHILVFSLCWKYEKLEIEWWIVILYYLDTCTGGKLYPKFYEAWFGRVCLVVSHTFQEQGHGFRKSIVQFNRLDFSEISHLHEHEHLH